MKYTLKPSKLTSLCLFALMILMLTACSSEKTAISANTFTNTLTQNKYFVADTTEEMGSEDGITLVLLAAGDNEKIQDTIQFYETTDADSARTLFTTIVNTNKTDDNLGISEEEGNWAKYTIDANGQFFVATQVDNTLIIADGETSGKAKIEDLLKDLGY